jgi:hypothetical protein
MAATRVRLSVAGAAAGVAAASRHKVQTTRRLIAEIAGDEGIG